MMDIVHVHVQQYFMDTDCGTAILTSVSNKFDINQVEMLLIRCKITTYLGVSWGITLGSQLVGHSWGLTSAEW